TNPALRSTGLRVPCRSSRDDRRPALSAIRLRGFAFVIFRFRLRRSGRAVPGDNARGVRRKGGAALIRVRSRWFVRSWPAAPGLPVLSFVAREMAAMPWRGYAANPPSQCYRVSPHLRSWVRPECERQMLFRANRDYEIRKDSTDRPDGSLLVCRSG